MRRPSTALVGLVGLVALTAGCGLKQQQLDALKQQSTLVNNNNGGVTAPQAPGIGAPNAPLPAAPGSGPAAPAPGTVTSTTGAVGPVGPQATAGPSNGPTSAVCSTLGTNVVGVTPTEIRIGIHAPQTGTGAPLPPSFQAGAAVYWNSHKVCGRTVVVDFQDDKYTPQTARDVCGPMSRRDFIVIGAAGTDQIQSCATMPDIVNNGVPYLSAGVTTNGLQGLKTYFAVTLTYAQQSSLVLRNAQQQKMGMKHWAVITSNTNNFKDARDSMESVLRSAGVPFDDIQVDATNDSGLQGRAAATGAQLATGCPAACKYDTVYLDTSPGYYIYMAGTASKQGFMGTYTGPGVTMTEVTVAQLVCSATVGVVKANFLAPYPGIDRATPDFKKATGNKYDDIYWSLWGLSQALDGALHASSSLTRPGFIDSMLHANLPNGVYPPTRFNGTHFGGTGVYSLRMNCNETEPNQSQAGQWDTVSGPLFK